MSVVVVINFYQERTRFVLILRDRDNFIILSRIKIKTIIKFPQIIKFPFKDKSLLKIKRKAIFRVRSYFYGSARTKTAVLNIEQKFN